MTITVEISDEEAKALEQSGLTVKDSIRKATHGGTKYLTSDAAVDAMQAFIRGQQHSGLSPEDLVALVHEGRR